MPKETNATNGHRPSVHVVLQAKGGVGKSFVAAILAQYFSRQRAVRCFDTDPGNATLAQYQALAAEHIGDLIQGGVINQKRFDPLIEKLLSGDGASIVDTGASTFLPFWNYVLENEILPSTGRPGPAGIHPLRRDRRPGHDGYSQRTRPAGADHQSESTRRVAQRILWGGTRG